VNETGVKRLKRFLAVCEAEGIMLEDQPNAHLNSVSIHDVMASI